MPEYEMLDDGSRNMDDVDSYTLLDDELGIGALKIPGMEKAMKDVNQIERKRMLKDLVMIHIWLCIMHTCLKWYKSLIQIALMKQKLRKNG